MPTREERQEGRWQHAVGFVTGIAEDPTETGERRLRAAKALAALEGRSWP